MTEVAGYPPLHDHKPVNNPPPQHTLVIVLRSDVFKALHYDLINFVPTPNTLYVNLVATTVPKPDRQHGYAESARISQVPVLFANILDGSIMGSASLRKIRNTTAHEIRTYMSCFPDDEVPSSCAVLFQAGSVVAFKREILVESWPDSWKLSADSITLRPGERYLLTRPEEIIAEGMKDPSLFGPVQRKFIVEEKSRKDGAKGQLPIWLQANDGPSPPVGHHTGSYAWRHHHEIIEFPYSAG